MLLKHNGRAPRCLRVSCEFESRQQRQFMDLVSKVGWAYGRL